MESQLVTAFKFGIFCIL